MIRTPTLLALALFAAALTAPPARAGDFTVGLSLSLNVGSLVYVPITAQDYLNGSPFSQRDYLVGVADAYRHVLARRPADDPQRRTFERTRLDLMSVSQYLDLFLESPTFFSIENPRHIDFKAPVAPLFLEFLQGWEAMESSVQQTAPGAK